MYVSIPKNRKEYFIDYSLLLLFVFVAFWPFVLHMAASPHDNSNLYLPWKHFITECFYNGELPIWNPFANYGFLQAADPGTWYPISWFFALFRPYDVSSLNYEMMFHYWLAGIGFYKIAKFYNFSRIIAISLAVCYMFSGFFLGNAQHGGWIVSGCWIPHVYYYFLQISAQQKLKYAIGFSISLFFLFTGGYFAFFAVLAYTLLIHYAIICIQKRKVVAFFQFAFAIFCFILLSLPAAYYIFEFQSFNPRAEGLPFDGTMTHKIVSGSFTATSLLSFLLPHASTINKAFWGIDASLNNIYIGVFPFLLLVLSIFYYRKSKNLHYLLIGLLFVCISLATIFPFRYWMYQFLPMMNIFRLSTFFRLFAIYFFLIAIGKILMVISTQEKIKNKFDILAIIAMVLSALSIPILFYQKRMLQLDDAILSSRVIIDLFFIIGFGVIYFGWKKYAKTSLMIILCSMMILDMTFHFRLNFLYTVGSATDVKAIDAGIAKMPTTYDKSSLERPPVFDAQEYRFLEIPFLWQNKAHFNKNIASEGNSPYYFIHQDKANKSGAVSALKNFPWFFFTTSNQLENIDTNTIVSDKNTNIVFDQFSPNHVALTVNTPIAANLVFQQNYFPLWQAAIDGKNSKIAVANTTFMAIHVPAGQHQIAFKVDNSKGKKLFLISIISLIALLIAKLIMDFRPQKLHLSSTLVD